MKILFTALLFMMCSSASNAADPLKTLSSIDDFAFGGIGAAGIPSEGEAAFKTILRRASAEKDFLQLLNSENYQAKCYALVALRSLKSQAYSKEIQLLKKDKTRIRTISGCTIAILPMSSVAAGIDAGSYDYYVKEKK